MALDSQSETAWAAWDSAAVARQQAQRACMKDRANQDLLRELEEAKENESEKKESYEQIQKQLEVNNTEMQALLVYLAAPKLTMREAVEFQYPLLNEPSNPGRPLSNAQSAAPQTYTEILPWELSEAACELINALDNTERLYYKPPCHAQREGRFEAEVDIRGRVVRVMDTVNAALKQQGSAVRCHGGGEGRSMSFADLAMRLDNMEEDNNLKDLSSRVLGIVLVRKNLGLKQGESLEEALKDPQRGGPIKAAVQEAYGMAVVDEAPVFALTSFNVTVFFKRSCDVTDKRLWASEPVWINQTDPSAAAVWVLVLQQAEKLSNWKAVLPRAKVPSNAEQEGEAGKFPSLSSLRNLACRLAADISEPVSSRSSVDSAGLFRKRRCVEEQQTDVSRTSNNHVQRGTPCPKLNLQASSPSSKGLQSDTRASAQRLAAIDFEAAATLPLFALGLTGELLGADQHSYTLKGTWEGEPAAVKVFNLRKRGAAAQYETEKRAYSLSDLHGKPIPRFLCSGLQAHTAAPVIVISYEGNFLAESEPVLEHLRE